MARVNFDYTGADENGTPLVFAAYGNNTDPANPASAAHFGAIQSIAAGCPEAYYIPPGPPGQAVQVVAGQQLIIDQPVQTA